MDQHRIFQSADPYPIPDAIYQMRLASQICMWRREKGNRSGCVDFPRSCT